MQDADAESAKPREGSGRDGQPSQSAGRGRPCPALAPTAHPHHQCSQGAWQRLRDPGSPGTLGTFSK